MNYIIASDSNCVASSYFVEVEQCLPSLSAADMVGSFLEFLPTIEIVDEIPDSFMRGWADVNSGRVVSIDVAHNQIPNQIP